MGVGETSSCRSKANRLSHGIVIARLKAGGLLLLGEVEKSLSMGAMGNIMLSFKSKSAVARHCYLADQSVMAGDDMGEGLVCRKSHHQIVYLAVCRDKTLQSPQNDYCLFCCSNNGKTIPAQGWEREFAASMGALARLGRRAEARLFYGTRGAKAVEGVMETGILRIPYPMIGTGPTTIKFTASLGALARLGKRAKARLFIVTAGRVIISNGMGKEVIVVSPALSVKEFAASLGALARLGKRAKARD